MTKKIQECGNSNTAGFVQSGNEKYSAVKTFVFLNEKFLPRQFEKHHHFLHYFFFFFSVCFTVWKNGHVLEVEGVYTYIALDYPDAQKPKIQTLRCLQLSHSSSILYLYSQWFAKVTQKAHRTGNRTQPPWFNQKETVLFPTQYLTNLQTWHRMWKT